MDDFFDRIKDNLEHRPEPEFDPQAWERMQRKLSGEQERKPSIFGWPIWMGGALLLLLGLGLYSFFLIRKLERVNQSLERLEQAQRTDTLIQTQIVYLTDTIYKTQIIREYIRETTNEGLASLQAPTAINWPAFSYRVQGLLETSNPGYWTFSTDNATSLSDLRKTLEASGIDLPNPVNTSWAELPGQIDLLARLVPPPLPIDRPSPYFEQTIAVASLRKAPLHQRLAKALEPKGFELGGAGGYVSLTNDRIQDDYGFTAGLFGKLRFSDQLSLWADISYLQLNYASTQMDSVLGVPIVESPADNFVFEKAVVPQKSLQYSVGMELQFANRSEWQPYIGIGFGAVSLLPYEVRYEFRNALLDQDLSVEKRIHQRELTTGLLLFKGGLQYDFAKRYSWIFEGQYRYDLQNSGIRAPDTWGIRTGVLYKF